MTFLLLLASALQGAPPPSGQPASAALVVTLLGTGNPRPAMDRFGPATLVETVEPRPRRVVVDAGRGVTQRLFQIGESALLSNVDLVLLTHLHSDHVVGLPDLWLTGWMFGRARPLPVRGPRGTRSMAAALREAFSFDVTMRRDVDEHLPAGGAELDAKDVVPGVVFEERGLVIRAFAVDHGPVKPAFGYKVEFGGRSVVLSGDTRASKAVEDAARGADVLVHEVVSPEVELAKTQVKDPAIVRRIIERHTPPEEAARLFESARPRLAVYSHVVPSPATAEDLLVPTRLRYSGRVVAGVDLLRITVGADIEVTEPHR